MGEYGRIRLARAAVSATALLAPLVLGGCQSGTSAHIGPIGAAAAPTSPGPASTPSATPPSSPTTTPSQTAPPTAPTTTAPANPTAGTRLTVFDGTSKVLMNGTSVDFGTEVHDLAWSPDGTKAAIIDGGGNLVVANADGTGKVEVAKNPGKDKWTHPAWQVTADGDPNRVPPKDFLYFGSSANGGTIEVVPATAHDGKWQPAPMGGISGPDGGQAPTTGNSWLSVAGPVGAAVYQHVHGSTTDIYYRDDYLRLQGAMKFANGGEPAFFETSANNSGTRSIAFVRPVNGHKHVFTTIGTWVNGSAEKDTTVDVTPQAAADATAPTWSPDGKTVAFATPAGIETANADGSGKITQVTTTQAIPVYRPGG